MLEIRRLNTVDEFNKGITALTEIFIEEYPYYSKWIEKNLEQFRTGEKQIYLAIGIILTRKKN